MALERKTITGAIGFNQERHGKALTRDFCEKNGEGWEIESYDPQAGTLTFTRQSVFNEIKVADEGPGSAKRDILTLGLKLGTRPTDGDRIATKFEDANPGYTLTKFEPFKGQAILKRLTPEQRQARDATAYALTFKPYDIQVSSRSDGGYTMVLPSYSPSKHDAKLQEVATSVVGKPGWYFEVDARTLTVQIIPAELPTFAPVYKTNFDSVKPVKTWDAKGDKERLSLDVAMALGGNGKPNSPLKADLDDQIGLLVVGLPGPHPLTEDVPVPPSDRFPNGWAKIGELKVGDKVYSATGEAEVTFIHPETRQHQYVFTFEDGSQVKSGWNHKWVVLVGEKKEQRELTTLAVSWLLRDKVEVLVPGVNIPGVIICNPRRVVFSKTGETVPMRCISVDGEIYIVGRGFIPTHNSGKSVTMQSIVYQALIKDFQLAIINTPAKKGDYNWALPYVEDNWWGCESRTEALTVAALVNEEGVRRGELLSKYGVNKWQELPENIKAANPPIFLVADELAAQLNAPNVPSGLKKEIKETNPKFIKMAQDYLEAKLLTAVLNNIVSVHRAVGIRVTYLTQRPSKTEGFPPELKSLLPHRVMLGSTPSESDKNMAYRDPKKVPDIPPWIQSDSSAARGCGAADLEGETPQVIKGYFATSEAYEDALKKRLGAGSPSLERVRPTEAQIKLHVPVINESIDDFDDDDDDDEPRRPTPQGFGRDGRDVADKDELKGAAKAAHQGAMEAALAAKKKRAAELTDLF